MRAHLKAERAKTEALLKEVAEDRRDAARAAAEVWHNEHDEAVIRKLVTWYYLEAESDHAPHASPFDR